MQKLKRVTDLDIAIGRRLREVRCAKRITQTEVAAGSGITFQQIQKYERGENRISVSRLVRVCAAMDVSASLFVADVVAQAEGGANV